MNTRRPADVSGQPYSSNMHSNDASERNEDHLQGHWSNGDPVHVITDGGTRRVAPNLNGATWVPPEFDRYREHDRVREFGGTCSCGSTYSAPETVRKSLDLDAAELMLEGLSDAPWSSTGAYILTEDGVRIADMFEEADAEFVSWARTGVPALIARVRAAEAELELLREDAASLVALLPDHWDDDVAEEALVSRFMATWAPADAALDAARQEDDYNDDKEILFRYDPESGGLVRVTAEDAPSDLALVSIAHDWMNADDDGSSLAAASLIETLTSALSARIANQERDAEAPVSEADIHDWFTSHSSAAVARVVADGQSVIDGRMADGVFA